MNEEERRANLGRVRQLRERLRNNRPPEEPEPDRAPSNVVRLREPQDGEAVDAPDDRWNERADLQ